MRCHAQISATARSHQQGKTNIAAYLVHSGMCAGRDCPSHHRFKALGLPYCTFAAALFHRIAYSSILMLVYDAIRSAKEVGHQL